ncbi:MAG: Gfo/Idh/MocA family oxidoreductase [Actinomycetia bacterium]|nr:Gfo/Idh/MocA family oxidoreductase [Actinomycetes bacterium]
MTSQPPLRTALIGPGRISVAHLDAITANSDATLVAVAGLPDEADRTTTLADRFHAERAVHHSDAVVGADDIDAVVLTVPNHIHAPLAIQLLNAGKHVLIEKPLTTNLTDADQMIETAERTDRTLMVGQCRRFFPGAQRARAMIHALGRPLAINHHLGVFAEHAATDWWTHASEAGGLAVGLNGPHVIDTMLWLIGARPVRVYAQTRRLRDQWEGEDEATFILDFDDGSIATGNISLNSRAPVNHRWINGPAGSLQLIDDRNLWHDGNQIVSEEVTPYIDGDASFRNQFDEFVSAIGEQRPPESSAVEARAVVAVMEAVQSSQEKGQPIQL